MWRCLPRARTRPRLMSSASSCARAPATRHASPRRRTRHSRPSRGRQVATRPQRASSNPTASPTPTPTLTPTSTPPNPNQVATRPQRASSPPTHPRTHGRARSRSRCRQAATLCEGGCNPMCGRLQPFVREAATLCEGGCNPMYAGAGCDAAVRCLRLLAALSRAHAPAQHVPQGHAWNELSVGRLVARLSSTQYSQGL